MNPHLIYISGEPGVGKTSLMAELTEEWHPEPMAPEPGAPARIVYLAGRDPVAVQLGTSRRDGTSGTDTLPASAALTAVSYLQSGRARGEAQLLLAEGARLAHPRFLTAAVDSGYEVTLLHLFGRDLARARREHRASRAARPPEDAAWVAARSAAARNLANACEQIDGITVVPVDVARLESDGPTGDYYARVAREWAAALGSVGALR